MGDGPGVLVVRDFKCVDQSTLVYFRRGEVQIVLYSREDVAELIRDVVGLDTEDIVRRFVKPVAQIAGAGGESRPLPGPALQVYGSSRPLGRGPSVHRRAACRL
jgi:hypothetical protein